MGRPPQGKTACAAGPSDPGESAEPASCTSAFTDASSREFQAALDGSACLGAWSHDQPEDRVRLSDGLAALLGFAPGATDVDLARVLSGIHAEDRPRIESILYAATESGGRFEAEFRTRPGFGGVRWLRLMGRCKRDPRTGTARSEGLAFDLTEGRLPPGTTAQRAQRQVNQLADHVIAMQGIAASLGNPPLSKAVHDVAVEVGFALARCLHATQAEPRH